MAASALIESCRQRFVHLAGKVALVLLSLSISPVEAQWTILNAPGQSTRATAKEPTILAIAKSARKLAVGHSNGKSVAFYHPDTAALLGTTNLTKEPVAIALSDDGSKAFALYDAGGIKIAVIDTATNAIVSTWSTGGKPVGMVLSGNELLVADSSSDRLVGFNTSTGAVTRTKSLSKEPQMINIGATPALILVGVKNGELQLLSADTLAVTRTVQVGDDIRSLAWWDGSDSGNGRVLAVGKSQNALNLIDPATGNIARVALGGDPNTVGIEQNNHWAYVGEKDDQIISLIDLIDKALSGYFTIPGKIGSILFDQQGGLLFVSLNKDDKLLKLDPNQASLISKVGVSKTLKDVAVNSATAEAVAISDKDADFARINLATLAVQTLALPVKADKVVVDAGLNVAIVGTTNNKLTFANLATNPASLYSSQVDLDGNIQDMAVDPTRNITVAVVSGKQGVRVVNNVTRTQTAAVQTADKYVAVAIHADKGIAYLVTENKKLSLFNLATSAVTQTISLSFDAEGIAVDPVLNRAVLTTKDQDKAWILNLDTLQMVTSLSMAKNPGAVAIQTDTHIAVVASKDDDSLSLIDLNTNTATLNFNRIDKPTGLAVSNRYNKVLVVSSDKNDLAIVQLANAVAGLNSISPAQVLAGAASTTLTVTGTHFVDGAVVYFGATALATTWVSVGSLTAVIPAALLSSAGTNNVRVQNPAPGGGTSASLVFTVVTPLPVLDLVNPVSVLADGAAKTFSLTGSNFYSPLLVNVGALSFVPTSNTLTSAQVTLPATLFNSAAPIGIVVTTTAGTSNSKTITVTATVPSAPVIGSATAGISSATIAFTAPASNGGSVITSYVATSSPGNFTGSCIAPCTSIIVTGLGVGIPYAFTVRASNAVGMGLTSAVSNSVTPLAGVPTLDSVNPVSVVADNTAKTFTLAGNNFQSPLSIIVGTQSFSPTSSTLTSAQVLLPTTMFATAGAISMSVKTGVGTSNAQTVNVTAIAPPAPLIGTATAGIGTATVTFSAPTSNGGSAITSYIATSSSGNYSGSCVAPCTSIIVTGLTAGVSYTFTVKASNAIGLSPASQASNSITLLASNLPTLSSVLPGSVLADNGVKLFTMSGSNFTLPMTVAVVGPTSTQTVTVNSTTPTSARIVLSESYFTTPGVLAFSVTTATGTSNTSTVTVAPTVPNLQSSNPATLAASGQAQMVTLTGTGFFAPVKVHAGGISIAVNPISATRLEVSVPGTLLTATGTISAMVEAAGGISNALTINIGADIPNQLPIVQINTPQAGDYYDIGTTVYFIVEGYDPDGTLANFELLVDGGVIATSPGGLIYTSEEYAPGPHTVLARATDDRGGVSEAVSTFYVGPNLEEAAVLAVWEGMNNALKTGNVATALTFLTTGAQEKYRPIFEALVGDMPAIIASYSPPSRGQISEDLAEYAVMRDIAGEGDTQVFFIYFSKGSDGKWLVDSM